jgi:GlpG protein
MRSIGQIYGESAAHLFSEFLYAKGISNEVDLDQNDVWTVWVRADEDLAPAADLLRAFRANPADPMYQTAAQQAHARRLAEKEDLERFQKRARGAQDIFPSVRSYRFGPWTFGLMVVCIAVFALMAGESDKVRALFFSESSEPRLWWRLLPLEVRQGEIWRLVTPIFLHFGLLHLLFNMMWLMDLGSMIEGRKSSSLLIVLVLVIACISNMVQFFVSGHPRFGGMSGVVYGLIGYIWIRGKFDRASGLFLHKQTVVTALIWFVACFTGIMGPVANGAHAGGLVIGMLWGWIDATRRA